MGEILSHAEVEAILCAIEPSPPSVRTVVIRDASDNVSENANWGCQDSRPEALRGAALKVVHALHEGICGRWQARLETLLQSQVVVRPVGACQSTVTVFFAAMTSPYVTGLISHAGSMAVSLLVWNTDLVRRLVGKMLGGSDGHGAQSDNCALTKIELRLLARLNDAVLGELSSLLGDTLEIGAVLQSPESAPDRVTTFPTAWFAFEVVCCGASGLIHIGVPVHREMPVQREIQGIAQPLADDVPELEGSLRLKAIPPGIQQISVRVSACLATLTLRAADLAGLQVGDVVMTDLAASEMVSLNHDGRRLGRATIGTHLGHKALRVTQCGGDDLHGDDRHGGDDLRREIC